jgi:hypothetical protein
VCDWKFSARPTHPPAPAKRRVPARACAAPTHRTKVVTRRSSPGGRHVIASPLSNAAQWFQHLQLPLCLAAATRPRAAAACDACRGPGCAPVRYRRFRRGRRRPGERMRCAPRPTLGRTLRGETRAAGAPAASSRDGTCGRSCRGAGRRLRGCLASRRQRRAAGGRWSHSFWARTSGCACGGSAAAMPGGLRMSES